MEEEKLPTGGEATVEQLTVGIGPIEHGQAGAPPPGRVTTWPGGIVKLLNMCLTFIKRLTFNIGVVINGLETIGTHLNTFILTKRPQ